ncbi:MAG: CHAT domain-containing protein [Minicystis sp.]
MPESSLPSLGRIVPRWSRGTITAVHNESFPAGHPTADRETITDDARVSLVVEVSMLADETEAEIRVRHCASGVELAGVGVGEVVVRAGRVVDAATGEAPELCFTAANMPWQVRQNPYFYFEVRVGARAVQTPRDYHERPDECLRVLLWSACVACVYTVDSTALIAGNTVRLPPLRSTRPEAAAVAALLGGVAGSVAGAQILDSHRISKAELGSLLRNTSVAHVAAHGLVAHRSEPILLAHEPPADLDPTDYRSLLVLTEGLLGDSEIQRVTNFPSVPRDLLYLSACLGGWEPSLCQAVIARGCRYVIAFRADIFDDDSLVMAREFYARWALHGLDPAKIPDCFFQVAPLHEERMKPVLFGYTSPFSADETPTRGDDPEDLLPPVMSPLAIVTPGARWGVNAWSLLRAEASS